jgi:hypothetical protein
MRVEKCRTRRKAEEMMRLSHAKIEWPVKVSERSELFVELKTKGNFLRAVIQWGTISPLHRPLAENRRLMQSKHKNIVGARTPYQGAVAEAVESSRTVIYTVIFGCARMLHFLGTGCRQDVASELSGSKCSSSYCRAVVAAKNRPRERGIGTPTRNFPNHRHSNA